MEFKKNDEIKPLHSKQEEEVIGGCLGGCPGNTSPYPAMVRCIKCNKVFEGKARKHWTVRTTVGRWLTSIGIMNECPNYVMSKCPDCGGDAEFNRK